MNCAVDPVYYDSVPWEFYLLEADIETVREAFDDPKKCELYATDVHRTPFYCMEKPLWEFSRFVQLRQSSWMRFGIAAHLNIPGFDEKKKHEPAFDCQRPVSTEEAAKVIVEKIHRDCERAWDFKKSKAAFISKVFKSRAIFFGYEDCGDTLYYELYDKGYWKESFMGGLYDSKNDRIYCELKSEIRPDCKPGKDKRRFVEETFHSWNIAIPFVSLLPDGKNKQFIRGELANCSVFSVDDIKGFDSALIPFLSPETT